MNQRILELREQAWALVSDEEQARGELYETRVRWERCDQKFAELIVRECARIVINNGIATATHDQMVRQDCVNDIKRHFGVKE